MSKISPLFLLPPVLFVVVGAFFFVGLGRENPNELPSQFVGRPAPPLQVERLGDYPLVTDADLRKPEVKLVNFWASWCVPCRVEHPNLIKMKEQGITIYGINYKDKPENGIKFITDLGNPFAKLGADSGRQAIEWGVYGIPETFVIDAKGRVVLRFPGPITDEILRTKIMPAIEKARNAG